MKPFGYARVSTRRKYLDNQIKELKDAGVGSSRIFTDKTFGSHVNDALDGLHSKVEENDVILILFRPEYREHDLLN